jgi:hypothetical protein
MSHFTNITAVSSVLGRARKGVFLMQMPENILNNQDDCPAFAKLHNPLDSHFKLRSDVP